MPVTLDLCDARKSEIPVSSIVTRRGLFLLENEKGDEISEQSPAPTLLRLETNAQVDETELHFRTGGLVHAVEAAYSFHRHLVLRPDDVWMAILTQFSMYVDRNAEDLREHFVSHEGQKQLIVEGGGTIDTADFGRMSSEMGQLLAKNLNDPSLRDWLIPDFTTTTPLDTITSSIIMMATFKAYFAYVFMTRCGIPKITLLGTRDDWVKLKNRLERLETFGKETSDWAKMLRPICDQFVSTFDAENDESLLPSIRDFWARVLYKTPRRSGGPSHICGWITAFCVFEDGGKWQGDVASTSHPAEHRAPGMVEWPAIAVNKVPKGVAEVPVLLDDQGKLHQCKLLAGCPGFQAAKGEEGLALSPLVGWAMYKVD